MPRSGIITLTTDFGTRDPYVGIMKGVILHLFPAARIVDITHEVPAHDVTTAALILMDAVPYFSRGTVHLAVVDPGVGTDRKPIAALKDGHFFVGPDNGVFSGFVPGEYVMELDRPELFLPRVSPSFHGRDVFAPVAARLAAGRSLRELGSPLADPVVLELPKPGRQGGTVTGEVVQVDSFGNLITNIPERMLPEGPVTIHLAGASIAGISRNYDAGETGGLVAIVGSAGRLEIARKQGSAAETLSAGRGTPVSIKA